MRDRLCCEGSGDAIDKEVSENGTRDDEDDDEERRTTTKRDGRRQRETDDDEERRTTRDSSETRDNERAIRNLGETT